MKKYIFFLLLLAASLKIQLASAQAAELEQLALNIEKLAQFKGILKDLKTSYDVAAKGYGTIRDISEGNFNIHRVFLDGLMAVNPRIARYSKVPEIISDQIHILSEYKKAWRSFSSSGAFSDKQLSYIANVYSNLFDGSLKNIDQLTMVLTASELRMTDDERIKAIDRLYTDMKEKLTFLRGFNRRAYFLQNRKQKALEETSVIDDLYHK